MSSAISTRAPGRRRLIAARPGTGRGVATYLRASHATWLVDEGFSVLDVAARLGHSFATVTTRHYARTVEGRDAEIALRLDAPTEEAPKVVRLPAALAETGTN